MNFQSIENSSSKQTGMTEANRSSRKRLDRWSAGLFQASTYLPLVLFLLILYVLFDRTLPILRMKPVWVLLSGTKWQPSAGEFGFLPFILGSVWVTVVAMLLSIPVSLFTAIYLAEYARKTTRMLMKPVLDILAGIPSVVYGLWGILVIVPWIQDALIPFTQAHLSSLPLFATKNPTGYGILAGGIVLAVMVVPFIISVCFEVMQTVPAGLHEASLAVGATRWQTVRYVVIPKTYPGLIAGVVLGTSRALGETMAVMMVVGNVPNLPISIFDAAYPLPALIANNYGEMMSIPLYDSALLGAALLLLVIVLIFNIASTLILRRMKERSVA